MSTFSLPPEATLPRDKAAILPAGLPTPTYGAGGSFAIACSTRIAATPSKCLDIVLDTSQYPSWNPFCRLVTIHSQTSSSSPDHLLQLGTVFTFDVHFNVSDPASKPSTKSKERVSALEDITDSGTGKVIGKRVCWVQVAMALQPDWALRCERVQEFVEVQNGGVTETEYRNWDTFYGPLAPVVKLAVGEGVRKGFEGWMEGLKKRAEES